MFERASVDELFLDVTEFCHGGWGRTEDGIGGGTEITDTVICHRERIDPTLDDADFRALRRGCDVARGIRRAVFDTLGFTLSAGVSTSKTVAKLAASYGKPNGQAVVLPEAIPWVSDLGRCFFGRACGILSVGNRKTNGVRYRSVFV